MSDSNWRRFDKLIRLGFVIAIFALGAASIWSFSAYRAEQNAQARYNSKQYADRTNETVEQSCSGRQGRALSECIAEIVDSTRENERAEYDLSAQREMALWALAVAFISLATLIVTFIGVYFVKRTLDATLRAVKDTTRATNAMEHQSRLAERGQRPWLSVEVLSLGPIKRGEDGRFLVDYQVKVSNTGASPAVFVGFAIGPEKSDADRKIAFAVFVQEANESLKSITYAIGPNSSETMKAGSWYDDRNMDENGLRPNRSIPGLWLGVGYQDGITKNLYYTMKTIILTGERVRPGDGEATFHVTHWVTKTFMGEIRANDDSQQRAKA